MTGRTARRRAYLSAAVALAVLGTALAMSAPAFSLARFTATAWTSGHASADQLAPPTALGASGGSSIALSWTPTVDSYATGYTVYRGSTTGGPYAAVGSVTPGSASSTTDVPGPGTWYYVLRSAYRSWSSLPSGEASATVAAPSTTGVTTCTSQAADTTGAGDGDGYESNPARACADDGLAAFDANSGTDFTSASCGTGAVPDPGKDRHRFWGYALGLPASVSAIAGVTVRADLALSNNGGTTNLCAQLSWDGGTTWTDLKSLSAAGTSQVAYTFGSSADTWGRTWSRADFDVAKFRVRIVDAPDRANKRFELDVVAVTVSYYP